MLNIIMKILGVCNYRLVMGNVYTNYTATCIFTILIRTCICLLNLSDSYSSLLRRVSVYERLVIC